MSGRPPAGTDAEAFFERWLPEAYQRAGCQAPADTPAVRVSLSGGGGGEWEIRARGDTLLVTRIPPGPRPRAGGAGSAGGAGAATGPGVWIRQSAADLVAAFAGYQDLPEMLPAGWSPLDLLFLDPRDLELLRQIDGRLLVEVEGRRRRRWALDLATGKAGLAAGRARATVRVSADTYEGLKDGTLPPLKALLERRIVVEGDRALAMQALMLLGARLSRSA